MSNELTNYEKPNLPAALPDLAKFVLVGRDKLNMVKAGIKALDKLDIAEGVRQQKKEEAQMLAEALLDAEVRIGEILAELPKAQGKRNDIKLILSAEYKLELPTKQDAIQELGFSRQQAERFQTLAANKDIVEQIKQEARESDDLPTRTAVLQAARIKKLEDNRAKIREELKGIELTADKQYRIIYADPPWMYDGGKPLSDKYGDVQKHYPPMETADICALPVSDLCLEDCTLFLWATAPKLPEALEVMKAWGFQYKTCIVWDKIKHNFGFYFSVRHELLLIGGKGRSTPDKSNNLHDSVISIERSDKHSEKPLYFRELIEQLYNGPMIELFARQSAPGWDVWGNQSGYE